ncbi:UNVERIFIED_CONTAM: hypothetical protein Scaly_2126300 [Sesamum calycinum]|uniref:Uncharacterized protein n=1 Tax=Sesamum calycinum TaxID=2727403 RepID=A0AAW2MND4_9LAMI
MTNYREKKAYRVYSAAPCSAPDPVKTTKAKRKEGGAGAQSLSRNFMPKSGSCDSTSVATAKLILDDGRLQEFPTCKVSYVLQKNPLVSYATDEMDFDDVVSAVSDDEELQPGQLYFALPLSRLKHRLQAEEMAALAVKASSALTKRAALW